MYTTNTVATESPLIPSKHEGHLGPQLDRLTNRSDGSNDGSERTFHIQAATNMTGQWRVYTLTR